MIFLIATSAILALFAGLGSEPPLVLAARNGDAAEVRRLLATGADLEAGDEHGVTALMFASAGDHREIVEDLLQAGARVDAPVKDGVTALVLAAINGPHLEVMRDLLQAGAGLEELTRQFQHPRWEVRVRTIMAFAMLYPGGETKDAVPALAEALRDRNLNIRYWAAEALGRIGPQARGAVPRLLEALKTHPDREPGLDGPYRYYADARAAAASALGAIDGESEEAVLALRIALTDENELVRENAAKALERAANSRSSVPEGAIAALPLPPAEAPPSAPALVEKSVSWTSRDEGVVGYEWKAVLQNENSTAARVTLSLRLRDSGGQVLHEKETETVLAPRARVTVTSEGSMPEEVANRGAYWTFDLGDVRSAETPR